MATTTHIEEKPRVIIPRAGRGNEILAILFIALGIVGNLPGAIYYLRGTPPERRLGGAGDAITP